MILTAATVAQAAPPTVQYMTIVFPLVTAVITFVLTSFFTLYREKKAANVSKRVIIVYAEYQISYPFEEKVVAERHGRGMILFGDNGKKLSNHANREFQDSGERSLYSYMVVKNTTANDIINVKIKTVFENSGVDVEEVFFIPVWKNDMVLYLPQSVFGGNSHLSTNKELNIIYTTSNFEKFNYSYKITKRNEFKERLKKRYLGFIWITLVRYYKNRFYSFENVK
jgi:hypothetical protein